MKKITDRAIINYLQKTDGAISHRYYDDYRMWFEVGEFREKITELIQKDRDAACAAKKSKAKAKRKKKN